MLNISFIHFTLVKSVIDVVRVLSVTSVNIVMENSSVRVDFRVVWMRLMRAVNDMRVRSFVVVMGVKDVIGVANVRSVVSFVHVVGIIDVIGITVCINLRPPPLWPFLLVKKGGGGLNARQAT